MVTHKYQILAGLLSKFLPGEWTQQYILRLRGKRPATNHTSHVHMNVFQYPEGFADMEANNHRR
jgi:hypothetical protein